MHKIHRTCRNYQKRKIIMVNSKSVTESLTIMIKNINHITIFITGFAGISAILLRFSSELKPDDYITCRSLWKCLLKADVGCPTGILARHTCVNIWMFLTISWSSTPGIVSVFTTKNPSGGRGSINSEITSTSSASSTYKQNY